MQSRVGSSGRLARGMLGRCGGDMNSMILITVDPQASVRLPTRLSRTRESLHVRVCGGQRDSGMWGVDMVGILDGRAFAFNNYCLC